MNKKLLKIEKGARRQAAVVAGEYDGRFRNRTFTDRKKKQSKNLCRGKVNQD